MNPDAFIQLLIVSNQSAHVNVALNALRNKGYSLQLEPVNDLEDLKENLSNLTYDAILYYSENCKISSEQLLSTLKKSSQDMPVLMMSNDKLPPQTKTPDYDSFSSVIHPEDIDQLTATLPLLVDRHRLTQKNQLLSLQLKELNQRLESLFQHSPVPQAYIADGIHIVCNQAYLKIFQAEKIEDLINTPLLDYVEGKQKQEVRDLLAHPVQHPADVELSLTKGREEALNIILTVTPEYYQLLSCLHIQVNLETGNQTYSREIAAIDKQDFLTQLDSRTFFIEKLEGAIRSAISESKFSTLLIIRINELLDIQSFVGKKNTNQIIKDIGRFLRESINKPFSATRLNNYEFGLLLHDSTLEDALTLSQFVKNKINNRITSASLSSFDLSCSTGIAVINGNALDADDLITRAHSNSSLGNQPNNDAWAFRIEDSLQPDIQQMANYVEKALEDGHFRFLFQPIVDLKGVGFQGYEVLTRILDTDGNDIPPAAFLPAINLQGLSERFDRAIIRNVVQGMSVSDNSNVTMNVNTTTNTITSRTFLSWLNGLVQEYPIDTSLLILQISEAMSDHNLDDIIRFCNGLEEIGINYSLTNFGCAVEPFKLLDIINPALIALDESLIRDIPYSNHHRENVRAMVTDLHTMKHKVTAPNIDDMDILPVLWDIGVDLAQGYCLQRPSDEMNFEFVKDEEITLGAKSSS